MGRDGDVARWRAPTAQARSRLVDWVVRANLTLTPTLSQAQCDTPDTTLDSQPCGGLVKLALITSPNHIQAVADALVALLHGHQRAVA